MKITVLGCGALGQLWLTALCKHGHEVQGWLRVPQPYCSVNLIDEDGTVFHESINHMPLGRNVAEFIRLVDAYAHVQTHGEVCPANWEEGKEAMKANRISTAEYLSKN